MAEANVTIKTTTLSIIAGDQVKDADTLTIGERKLLTVKGGRAQDLVARIFTEFSQRLDRAGNKFQMSRKWRGLSHTDPYGAPARISGPELESYLADWFVFCELVHQSPPHYLNAPPPKGNDSYFRLVDSLPTFVSAQIAQSRFITPELISLFEVIG